MAEKSHFISEISHKSGIKEDIVWDIVRNIAKKSLNLTASGVSAPVERKLKDRKDGIARMLFGLIFWQERAPAKAPQNLDIRQKLCTIIDTETVALYEQRFTDIKDDLIFEAEESFAESRDFAGHISELINNLKEELLRDEFAETMRKLHIAEREKDDKKTLELLERCQKLSLELRELSKR